LDALRNLKTIKQVQVGSFIKWAGGKGQLLEQYTKFFPRTLQGRDYVEPFVGSGAVFFFIVQSLNPKSCTLLDINPELINTWCVIRDDVSSLIECLTEHKARHNALGISEEERKIYYYHIRANPPTGSTEKAARFIYLNKTCFNGLHRLNSKGQFNVPMGSYKQPSIFNADHLKQISRLLEGVNIEVKSFEECERYISENAFVYFDPPYEPLSETSNFTSYAKDGFSQQHQRELRDLVQRIGSYADWMLSNSTAPLIKELYASPRFHKHRILANRAINSVASSRGKVEEFLITNLF
jgi:DNA adenine methylase